MLAQQLKPLLLLLVCALYSFLVLFQLSFADLATLHVANESKVVANKILLAMPAILWC